LPHANASWGDAFLNTRENFSLPSSWLLADGSTLPTMPQAEQQPDNTTKLPANLASAITSQFLVDTPQLSNCPTTLPC
jgi:hypothetical protein